MAELSEVERALQRDPDDAELRLVFADSLIACGDPRGELIVLASRPGSIAQRRRERELRLDLERQLAEVITVDSKRCARLVWQRGTIERVDFDLTIGSLDALAELLARPELAFLRDLDLRMGWPITSLASEAALAELPGLVGELPLRCIGIGHGRMTLPPARVAALWHALPGLDGMALFGERTDDLVELIREHRPRLVELGGLDLDAPRLVRLFGELWPGITSFVVHAQPLRRSDLEPLVEPGAFPELVRVGVMGGNDAQNDTFVELLVDRGPIDRLQAIGMSVHRAEASNRRLLQRRARFATVELFTAPVAAVRGRGEWAEPWHDLGHLFDELGRHDRALAEFEALVTLVPHDARFLQDVGDQLASLGRHDEALAPLDAALVHDPDQERALHSRAVSLSEVGRLDDALEAWDRVQQGERVHEAYLWDGRAETLARLGRFDDALAAYDRSLELVRGDVDTLLRRAEILAHVERFADAIDQFTKITRRKTASAADKARAHGRLAILGLQLGKPAVARRHFDRAAIDGDGLVWLATAHAGFLVAQRDAAAAEAVWQRVSSAAEPRGYTLLELGRAADALAAFEATGADRGRVLALHALGRSAEARALNDRLWTEQTCPYAFAITALAAAALGDRDRLAAIRSAETEVRASHEAVARAAAAVRTTSDDEHRCRSLAACRSRTTVALIVAALADGAPAEAGVRARSLNSALAQWNSTSPRLHEVRLLEALVLGLADPLLARAIELAEGLTPRTPLARPKPQRLPRRPTRPV